MRKATALLCGFNFALLAGCPVDTSVLRDSKLSCRALSLCSDNFKCRPSSIWEQRVNLTLVNKEE